MESLKKDLDSDRTSLMRRIVGECVLQHIAQNEPGLLAKPSCWANTKRTKPSL